MATTTPNFGWPVPTSTDLVKDGATAIEALGDSIDASLLDLKGGTTGQVLSKNSGTDMDFTWVTEAAGDITGVTAGTGISGGGTSGTVTVTNSMATAITTAGDLIKGTGSGTFDRLGIGSTGQVLTVASGVPSWATPSSGGMTLLSTTTLTGTTTTISSIDQTYTNLLIRVYGITTNSNTQDIWAGMNGYSGSAVRIVGNASANTGATTGGENQMITDGSKNLTAANSSRSWTIQIADYSSASGVKVAGFNGVYVGTTDTHTIVGSYSNNSTSAVTSIYFKCNETFATGTVKIWGVK